MENLPSDLPSYHISLNNQSNALICELEYSGKIFHSDILETDLKSGLVSLAKLKNIIQLNSKITQPNFIIKLNKIFNELMHENNLVLNIKFSSDIIDFEENIYFREKNAMIEDYNQIKKLNEIVVEQENKIEYLEDELGKTILKANQRFAKLEDKIKCLEDKLAKIEGDTVSAVYGRGITNKFEQLVVLHKNLSCSGSVCGLYLSNIGSPGTIISLPDIENSPMWSMGIIKSCIKEFVFDCNVLPKSSNLIIKEFAELLNSCLQCGRIDQEIQLDCECSCVSLLQPVFTVLKKYKNYKKLTIQCDDENFNDFGVERHCKLNNIEYNFLIKILLYK
jgi:hypothetical protein